MQLMTEGAQIGVEAVTVIQLILETLSFLVCSDPVSPTSLNWAQFQPTPREGAMGQY